MLTFCAQQWRAISLLMLAALWIGVFPVWSRWITTAPLDIPISLVPPGKIEQLIEIVIPENYALSLIFEREGVPFEQLDTLLGSMRPPKAGETLPPGIRVPIRWSLTSAESRKVAASGDVDSIGTSGWSAAEVTRHLGYVQASPGKYIFQAKVLRSVPELAHIRTRIAIHLRPKSSSSWQIGLVWWGSIGTYLVAWPAAAYGAFLLLCGGLTRQSTRTLRDKAAQRR
jgi:hypothetical protein